MTDLDRNIRTGVICFVIAVLSLTALRLVEVKNIVSVSGSQVLGAQSEKVVLPNAEVETQVLHANYIKP